MHFLVIFNQLYFYVFVTLYGLLHAHVLLENYLFIGVFTVGNLVLLSLLNYVFEFHLIAESMCSFGSFSLDLCAL